MKPTYKASIRCYFTSPLDYTQHWQTLPLKDIPKWIEAYQFTHPNVRSISVKIWTQDGKEERE